MHGKEDYYNKTGIFKPYYNVQIGVSDGYILHLDLFDNPTDTKTFIPFMDSYDAHYGEYPLLPVADAGYGSYDNYLYSLTKGMKLMMKYNTYSYEKTKKFQKNEFHIKNMRLVDNKLISESGEVYEYDHEYTSYKGQYPKHKTIYRHVPSENSSSEVPKTISRDVVLLEVQAEAKNNLESALGIECRVQRSIEVEGAFAEIKHNGNCTRFHRRGKNAVKLEFMLITIGYNLRKYHNNKLTKLN